MEKKAPVFFLAAALLICGVLSFWDASREQEAAMNRYTATFLNVFDTRTEVVGYAESEEEFNAQVELLKEKLMRYHKLFDIYNDYENMNNIKTINDNAGVAPVAADPEIIDLLIFCKEMYERSEGQVNVAMGSVLSIWHTYREAGMEHPEKALLPDMEELRAAQQHTDIDGLRIDKEAGTVYLEDPEMSLDVGGIGKGYAAQRTAEYAKELGMDSLLLSVGGNVCAVGSRLDGSLWTVGIQNPDPDGSERYVQKLRVSDCSVVTSGNYQRYYMVDGKRYCHIIDPDTLMPADYFDSVTVVTEDSGLADAMSTTLYNMTPEEGLAYVNQDPQLEAVWILKDGSFRYSDGFAAYVEK